MSRQPKTEILDAEEQLLVRLAWACEVQGLTQAQAAEMFGITRLKVNRSLAEARARGIVRVSINSPLGPCAELEDLLRDRFELDSATVAPVGGEFNLYTIIGAALGQFLTRFLARKDVRLFGMSWGNTLSMATRFIEPLERPDLEITSVMGGLAKSSDVNTYEITTRLADLCQSAHSYLTAPIYVSTAESREIILRQQVFRRSIENIRSADGLAFSAGDMRGSLLLAEGLPEDVIPDDLIAAGAVGEVLGYFLDVAGTPVDHPINSRVLGIELDDLNNLPNVIVASGGDAKVPILHAILRRGCVNHIVTDEHTARALVARGR